MRTSKLIMSAAVLSAMFWTTAFATTGPRTEPFTVTQSAPLAGALPVPPIACTTLGSDVSVLINSRLASRDISAARAVFQRGVAYCMEGKDREADRYYQEAGNLLRGHSPTTAATL